MIQPTALFRRPLAAMLTAVLALPGAALAQSSPDGAASAPAFELAPPAKVEPVGMPVDGLDLENAGALKGVRKIALAGVSLYVLTESSGSATAGAAFRDRSMAYVNSSLKVTGLDVTRLQALADTAHDRIVAALQERGIEVVALAALQALPEFAELSTLGDKHPMALDVSAGKGTVFSARGLPLFHQDEQAWLSRTVGGLFGAKVEDPYVALGDKMSAGFRKTQLDPVLERLGRATGAAIAMVRVVLTAAQIKASGGAWSLSASTAARDSLVMPAWTNRIWLLTPQGERARASLKFPLVSETPPGRIVDVTSTGAKVADVATTVLTFAAALSGHGRGVVQSTKELELRTTPDWFDAVAKPQVAAALSGLAQALGR